MSTSPLPGDASNDPTDDQTGRFVVQPNGRVRPLSPHLQVWRWHGTMLASILHRISGGALSVGAVLVVLWLAALALGPDAYATFTAWMGSPLGLLVWFGLSAALIYHFAAGVRHLIWDSGKGLSLKDADALSIGSIVFGVVVTLAFWIVLFSTGRVAL
ncbi:MAG: succinate dehydrogenase, cytochrome b556 subunit [Alphaproteobacteria bacterium]|jgi:succinate dehydrogenase / fumarate reductase, cytochrome b subunit|nr:succinate dehydrogenase, cytochrome b556 subunit [Alphaproteobacteria bacterium]MBU2043224.1 succinate dehydrogenase, cytochrome b556 subunit [Alphaproteobacteria bacterium]MBU2125079.1 succinate dehydrogenase, cytochrome b556 subunit [Alphaproteobacteria bacterium]MBU2208434.1 succinate dehydrogenase, cytochrome b556 subunit [Alphaproteobacteria bacterium]MBU2290601.1 succinate dehydrogenase, cytochrome b556 subunit [Alphaproteobacteria bacterium]